MNGPSAYNRCVATKLEILHRAKLEARRRVGDPTREINGLSHFDSSVTARTSTVGRAARKALPEFSNDSPQCQFEAGL
ncbi:hypothetical protein GCM10027034_20060 [Ramlibacter solisilvae]